MGLKSDAILTPAETRIAVGYAEGLIGKEIAQRAGISYNTVVRHTQNIYEKTGIRRSPNALGAWFLSLNYGIDLSELRRRYVAMEADDDMICRRMRRTRRRDDAELMECKMAKRRVAPERRAFNAWLHSRDWISEQLGDGSGKNK